MAGLGRCQMPLAPADSLALANVAHESIETQMVRELATFKIAMEFDFTSSFRRTDVVVVVD